MSRYLDGAATPEEIRALDAQLKRDPEARRQFLLLADQDAAIGQLVDTLEQRDAMVRRVSSRRRRVAPDRSPAPLVWMAVAAAILIAVLLATMQPSPTPRAPRAPIVRNEPTPPAPTPAPVVVPVPVPEIPAPPTPEFVPTPPPRVEIPTPAPDPSPVVPSPPPREERRTVPDPTPVVPSVVVAQVDGDLDARAPFPWKEGTSLAARAKPASVVFENGTRLTMAPGAELKLATAQPLAVGLEKGEVYCSVAPSKTPALTVLTAAAEAKVLGTHFSVALEGDSTRISVDEGSVRVTRRGDQKALSLRAGQSIQVGAGLPFAASARAANLLSDPGFEAGGRGWKGFEGSPPSFGPELRLSQSPVHRGKSSLHVTEGFQGNFCQGVSVTPGSVYEFEGWVKIPESGAWGMSVVWLDETGNWKAWVRADNLPTMAGARDWTRWSGRFAAPARAKTAWIVIYGSKPGAAFFDDFHVGQISR